MWTDTALKVIVASLLHFPVAVWFSNWEECLGKTRIPVLGACLLLNSPAQVGLCLIHSSVVSTCMDMQHWHCCFRYYCPSSVFIFTGFACHSAGRKQFVENDCSGVKHGAEEQGLL